jgi:hypothetical protein
MRQNLLHVTAWKAGESVYFPTRCFLRAYFLRPHDYAKREYAQPPLSCLNKKKQPAPPADGFWHFKFSKPAYAGFEKAPEPKGSAVADRLWGDAHAMAAIRGWIIPPAGLGRISSDFSPSLRARVAARDGGSSHPGNREGNDGGRR